MVTDIGKRVYDLLNKQISESFQTSLMFLAIDGVFCDMGLNGCANWAKRQYTDAHSQAIEIFDHIMSRGGKVRFMPIPAFKQDWRAPLHIFEETLRIQTRMATCFCAIADSAVIDKDHVTHSFIAPFVQKQAKKEAEAAFLLDRLRKMQSTELGVILFDTNIANDTNIENLN